MSLNLIDLAKGYLTSTTLQNVSSSLGESPESVEKGFSAALPAVMSGLMNTSSSNDGLSTIMNLMKGSSSDILDNFSGVSQNPAAVQSQGSSILSSLFGSNLGSIVSSIATFAGLRNSSSSSLLSMAAPLLMGVIGRQVNSQGLGLSGLAGLLMGQRDHVNAAMPSGLTGLSSLLNMGSTSSNLGNSYRSTTSTPEPVVEPRTGGFNWMPWLLGALLLVGALWAWRNCNSEQAATTTEAAVDSTAANLDSAASAVGTAVDTTASNVATAVGNGLARLGNFFKRTLPNGVELNIPENGIENNLVKFIEDGGKAVDKTTWFNFDRINFDTGSSALTADSKEQVKNIAEILKAFPNVNIKIGGYTDNTGNAAANVKLSNARANAVMNAIVGEGIDKARLEAEGYGQEHPVASNDTEEGRAQNRRIAVRVTKK